MSDDALRDRIRLSDQRRRTIAEQEHAAMLVLERHHAATGAPLPLLDRPAPALLPPPRVSIVVPVFNGRPFLEDALQSALAQTYRNLEILIVDDGSDDGGWTETTGRRFASEHPERVRYIRRANGGAAAALNTGVHAMTGQIFCWLSHDDLFAPDKTAVQVDAWRRIGRPDAMLISDYGVVDTAGKVLVERTGDHALYAAAPRLPLYRGGVNGCTVFIPAKVLRDRVGPFDPSLRYAGDYKLWAELLQDRDFIHLPRTLVYMRRHEGQDSHKPAAAAEGEAVWRGMIGDLSEVRRAQLYGSTWRFLDETHRILSRSAYSTLAQDLAGQRDRCLPETLISVVLAPGAEMTDQVLETVLAQSHPRFEVVVPAGSSAALRLRSERSPTDRRIRLVDTGAGDELRASLWAARGAYLAFAGGRTRWAPDKLSRQLEAMARAGAVSARTDYLDASGRPAPGDAPIAPETVMIHRSVVAGGFQPAFGPGSEPGWERLARTTAMLRVREPLAELLPAL